MKRSYIAHLFDFLAGGTVVKASAAMETIVLETEEKTMKPSSEHQRCATPANWEAVFLLQRLRCRNRCISGRSECDNGSLTAAALAVGEVVAAAVFASAAVVPERCGV